ncbi:ABC transporter ATP-binding protein [Mycoplasmopsis californica]|uniref:ABC transporter ATP-binding protein n=1 Tax=Mycoplasmopsis equigenitalium TaxID=114883 RepID=A0ABY5J4B1_9BACT|nr:ABC transporter ATP-binding protein [Mycoplasmopsis equigenitalium]UUD36726.1 ABC transporter ATP-binding protein [Mycoplasmopsis equigenitalium]VEU69980.1 ABC transporter ATP-binding protein [Mycoplasmopsis californica]
METQKSDLLIFKYAELSRKNIEKQTRTPIIAVRNFTKKFKNFVATDNVSFDIYPGTIHGFIGPNGSGKTTTIKSIIGAYISGPNQIKIKGFKPGSPKANRLIGYIPEKASFPSHLNAEEYLATMATFNGMKMREAIKKANEILIELKLEKHKRRNPNTFSSGMKKKILLAQSLMSSPEILILDEPAANLDPTARKELFDTFFELKKRGITIFISSHVLSELERIVDEITFIFNGKVLFSGSSSKMGDGQNDLYFKTNQNKYFKDEIRNTLNLEVSGDISSELVVRSVSEENKNKIIDMIRDKNVILYSLRHNDLQSFYDNLIRQYYEQNNQNNQKEDKNPSKSEQGGK